MYRAKTNQRENRTTPYARGDPDGSGRWGHDLHPSTSSGLAGRISGSGGSANGRPTARGGSSSLSSRINSQKGRELLSDSSSVSAPSSQQKLYGFGDTPPVNPNNVNSGYELLPGDNERGADGGVRDPTFDQRTPGQGAQGRQLARSVFTSGVQAAGLGNQADREKERQRMQMIRDREKEAAARKAAEESMAQRRVNILGQGKIWVRVENLAQGTTAEDVQSAFAPSPILSARLSPSTSSSSNLVSIDLEFNDRTAAEELVNTYNGVVADGNALKVGIVPNLAGRLGSGVTAAEVPGGRLGSRLGNNSSAAGSRGNNQVSASAAGKELLNASSTSKMYSDAILQTDTRARVMTVADQQPINSDPSAAQRQDAWLKSGGGQSLSQRVGGGGSSWGSGGGMRGW